MAKRATKKSKPKKDLAERVIDAALALAAEHGWSALTMADIAKAAEAPLAEVLATFSSKPSILNGLIRRVDNQVLSGLSTDDPSGDDVRDRLFDVLMRRFDALQPHKKGLAQILRGSLCNPLAPVNHLPRYLCSMALMLEAGGVSSAGLGGRLRTKGLAVVYANAFRIWLRDDSPDMAKTMAALDNGLKRAECLANLCWGQHGNGEPAAETG